MTIDLNVGVRRGYKCRPSFRTCVKSRRRHGERMRAMWAETVTLARASQPRNSREWQENMYRMWDIRTSLLYSVDGWERCMESLLLIKTKFYPPMEGKWTLQNEQEQQGYAGHQYSKHMQRLFDHFMALWLQRYATILLFSRFSAFPNRCRPPCTTMPWTIWPALMVLWGVCWMFYPGYAGGQFPLSLGNGPPWPVSQGKRHIFYIQNLEYC